MFCVVGNSASRHCYLTLMAALLIQISDWFDVLDGDNRLLLTEREVLRNLQAVVSDADKTPVHEAGLNEPKFIRDLYFFSRWLVTP